MLARCGSTRKQRYSSVPPLGATGVYGSGIRTVTKRSPGRSGAGGGIAATACPPCGELVAPAPVLVALAAPAVAGRPPGPPQPATTNPATTSAAPTAAPTIVSPRTDRFTIPPLRRMTGHM